MVLFEKVKRISRGLMAEKKRRVVKSQKRKLTST